MFFLAFLVVTRPGLHRGHDGFVHLQWSTNAKPHPVGHQQVPAATVAPHRLGLYSSD